MVSGLMAKAGINPTPVVVVAVDDHVVGIGNLRHEIVSLVRESRRSSHHCHQGENTPSLQGKPPLARLIEREMKCLMYGLSAYL